MRAEKQIYLNLSKKGEVEVADEDEFVEDEEELVGTTDRGRRETHQYQTVVILAQ